MIVCICENVNQQAIREAIGRGHDTHLKLKKELNVCAQCCKCAEAVKQEIEYVKTKVEAKSIPESP